MSRKKITGSILTFVLLGLLTTACKHGSCHFNNSPEAKMEFIVDHLSGALDLTESQEVKVKALAEEIHTEMAKNKDSRKEVFETLLEEVKNDKVDKEKLNRLFDDKIEHVNEMKPFFIDKFAELHDILTVEQRSKLAEKMKKFHEKMGQ